MKNSRRFYRTLGKRAFDLVVVVPVSILMLPVFLVVAFIVWLDIGSPIIFRQTRAGKNDKPFTLYKFRTMKDTRDAEGKLLPDTERLTRVGAFLRRSSLDELPQLWNILKGEMSLVGPRPLYVAYLPYYTERECRRHWVRPGITGLAQVNGRTSLLWEDRLDLDVQYVEDLSLWGDIEIIFKTFYKVMFQEDIRDYAPQGSLSSYREQMREEKCVKGGA
jgi:undecaprenyl phosphate N,N'-diacetylbacillosamine 1-phosphate transferase